uniref:Uncharacterized protein n=1 Tax=viral metagenome TaxID=1070528 RepID=A0A6H1ZB94_9ZZZZ
MRDCAAYQFGCSCDEGQCKSKDAEIETLKKVLETIRAICRGASAAGKPEMGLQTVIDCVNIAIDPGVVEEVSDAE